MLILVSPPKSLMLVNRVNLYQTHCSTSPSLCKITKIASSSGGNTLLSDLVTVKLQYFSVAVDAHSTINRNATQRNTTPFHPTQKCVISDCTVTPISSRVMIDPGCLMLIGVIPPGSQWATVEQGRRKSPRARARAKTREATTTALRTTKTITPMTRIATMMATKPDTLALFVALCPPLISNLVSLVAANSARRAAHPRVWSSRSRWLARHFKLPP